MGHFKVCFSRAEALGMIRAFTAGLGVVAFTELCPQLHNFRDPMGQRWNIHPLNSKKRCYYKCSLPSAFEIKLCLCVNVVEHLPVK